MQKIKPSWKEELISLQTEMGRLLESRRTFKNKIKLFWRLFNFCFLWKDSNIKLSMDEFPQEEWLNSEHIIKKVEVDWSKAPEIFKITYMDNHIETY
jgi:hypothetical protein